MRTRSDVSSTGCAVNVGSWEATPSTWGGLGAGPASICAHRASMSTVTGPEALFILRSSFLKYS